MDGREMLTTFMVLFFGSDSAVTIPLRWPDSRCFDADGGAYVAISSVSHIFEVLPGRSELVKFNRPGAIKFINVSAICLDYMETFLTHQLPSVTSLGLPCLGTVPRPRTIDLDVSA